MSKKPYRGERKKIIPKKVDYQIAGVYAQGKGDFGFVDVEGREKGYYVFGRNSMNAMSGDKVGIDVKEFNGKEEATVKTVLERRKDPIVGIYKDSGNFGFVTPNDPQFKKDLFVAGSKSMRAQDGNVVAVEIMTWEGRSPEGKVVRVLGKPEDQGVDILALAVENGARMGFGDAIQKELKQIMSPSPSGGGIKGGGSRKNLKNLFTITIDGADSKDLDDAISVEKLTSGNYKLFVHIADVAHYVREDHAIDKEARRRATSIYLVNQVIPMLPKELSNGLCSLNPNEEKLTLTCEIEINSKGHIVETEVYESIIESDYRMTYKEVDEIVSPLSQPFPPREKGVEQKNIPSPLGGGLGRGLLFGGSISQQLISMLNLSEELRAILQKHKKSLGVLEFDFPETKIEVDDNGNPIAYKKYERYNSNKIIEEFMIMANEAVSRKYAKLPFLYRVHPKPTEEDIDKLYKSLAIFSYKVPQLQDITSKDIQIILDQIKDDAREKLLSKMVLRSLTKAVYSEEREGHFGLALDYYSHFTSPIRRYPDLQIHRIIKEKIAHKLNGARIGHYKNILPKIAKISSEAEIKAEKLEYKIKDLMACKFMKGKVGEQFDAYISGAIQHGVFVELENTIEGFVELNEKHGIANYVFDPDMMELKNSVTGEKFTIGDAVKVELINVDDKLFRLDFALVR